MTCSVHMAVFLCELLTQKATTSARGRELIECSLAAKTILDELGRPDHNGVVPNIDPSTLRFPMPERWW